MIILVLIIAGLCFGSFINALVWRMHEQSKVAKSTNKYLSIVHGRSMCPNCKHILTASDLLPVISWIWLKGKCRYCKKPISWQYPLVEIGTAILFIGSYIYWPYQFDARGITIFIFWLIFLIGFMALVVYDLRWFLLPNSIVYLLFALAITQVLVLAVFFNGGLESLLSAFWGFLVGGGLFYILYQLSDGKWIGGGDVKLGALLGILVGGPLASLLLIFIASSLGTLIAIPLLLSGRIKRGSHLPFGPFLILATIIVSLLSLELINWLQNGINM